MDTNANLPDPERPEQSVPSILNEQAASSLPQRQYRWVVPVSILSGLLLVSGLFVGYQYFSPSVLPPTNTVANPPSTAPIAPPLEPVPTSAEDDWATYSFAECPITLQYPSNADILGSTSGEAMTLLYPSEAPPDDYLFLSISCRQLTESSLLAYATQTFQQDQNNQDTIIKPLAEIMIAGRIGYTYTTEETRSPGSVRRLVMLGSPDASYVVWYVEQIQAKDGAELREVSERILNSMTFF